MANAIEGGRMKRVLLALFMLLGFVVAGCEREVIREYPRGPYPRGGYRREGFPRGERHREYRLSDESLQNGQTLQIEAEIQE
jgi:hypothetical protein